jgi:hypothetical protein
MFRREARGTFLHQQFLRLIPDYDYSNEMVPEVDPTDGRKRFYGNKYTGRLCDLDTSPGSQDDATTTRETDADNEAGGERLGDRRNTKDRHSAPSLTRTRDRAGIPDAYRGSAPKRISSPAQIAAKGFPKRATEVAAYFGA